MTCREGVHLFPRVSFSGITGGGKEAGSFHLWFIPSCLTVDREDTLLPAVELVGWNSLPCLKEKVSFLFALLLLCEPVLISDREGVHLPVISLRSLGSHCTFLGISLR